MPTLAAAVIPVVLVPAGPPERPVWTMFGGTPARNQVSASTSRLSHEFPTDPEDTAVRVPGDRVKWKATLGSRSYSQPVVVGDRVLIGTNNENPRNKRDRGGAT